MNEVQLDSAELLRNLKALEADPDFVRLESLLNQFNIFEAIGVVRQELRHSDFLAALLNPQQNHGLGDTFIKRLLQKAHSDAELTGQDLSKMRVLREWQNIDILLLDDAHKRAIIIENKIDTTEHSNQLQRYYDSVQENYPGWEDIIALYLTPYGDPPSHEAYLPVSYSHVGSVLDDLVGPGSSTVSQDVRIAINHYIQMVRRHIVPDAEIVKLCEDIYQKHQKALDLIYQHRFASLDAMRTMLEQLLFQLIEGNNDLVVDESLRGITRFGVREWDTPILLTGKGWTQSNRVLLFVFENSRGSLSLGLYIGPVQAGHENVRQQLENLAGSHPNPFSRPKKQDKWIQIYSRSFLNSEDYENASSEALQDKVRRLWAEFVERDLVAIRTALREEAWLWQQETTSAS